MSISRLQLIFSAVVFLLAGFITSIIIENYRFPVTYFVCDQMYKDCRAISKYVDMDSCQREVKTGNWLCDEGNPNDIKCRVATDSIATAYCKN